MTTMVYTHVEYEWDGVAEQYVVKAKQGYEYDGPIILMKKKFKGLLGTLLKVVATIALTSFLGPAGTGFGTGLFSSAWAAGAASGAIVGGLTGGVKGALTGGILGGVGGYLGGDAGLGGGATNAGQTIGTDAAGNLVSSPTTGFSANGYEGAASVGTQGAAEVGASIGGDAATNLATDVAGSGGQPAAFDTASASASASAPTQSLDGTSVAQNASPPAGMNPSGNYTNAIGNNALPGQPGYGWDYYDNGTAISPEGQYFHEGQAVTGTGGQGTPGVFDGFDFKGAGLQVGKQLLGSAIGDATEPSYMKDYAKTMEKNNEASQRTTDYNMNMANKKAAVGDQLYGDAMAMSPDYYAEQQRRARQNQDSSAWGDAEQRLRAQGKDDNYINNERRRYDVATSQNQGTAYDSGWQAGMANRNNTFSTAGGMYGQVSYPQDTVSSGYANMAKMNQDRQQTIGRGIDAVWGAGTGGNKTGTEKTRDKDPNMGVSGGSIWGQQ